MRKAIIIILVLIIIISTTGILYITSKQKNFKNDISILEEKINPVTDDGEEDIEKNDEAIDFSKLLDINPDIISWLKIEGTNINYPVMKNNENGEFYLNKNFYKEEDPNGLPFLDERNSIKLEDNNIIIYGHNMKSGLIFHSLEKYEDEDFFYKNNIITLNTPTGKREFRIFAVLKEKITKENSFNYNMVTNFSDITEKKDFIDAAVKASLHNTNMDIDDDTTLLTLSTCDNITMDGRIAIISYEIIK